MGRLNMFSAKIFGLMQARQRQESLPFYKKTHMVLHGLPGQTGSSRGADRSWDASAGSCPSCCVSELLKGDIKLQNVFSGLQL